ncbi:Periplasmic nitrate reductase, partial [Bienertia sinuspersici]
MGRAGGLALLWNDDIEVNLRSMDAHHIDAMIGSTRWGHEENFDEILKGVWGNARNMGLGDWNESVRICGEQLKKWDANHCCWRRDLLYELFLPIDVERISKIPTSMRLPEDTICWVGSKDDIFKVKDADCVWAASMWDSVDGNLLCMEATTIREWLAWLIYSPGLTKGRVNNLLKEYRRAWVKAQDQRERNGSKWSPPPNGWIKINFDAGVNKEFNRVEIDVVAQNENGMVVAAKARTIINGWDAELAEATTAKSALELAKAQGSSYVQANVEDALALVSSFNDVKFNFCLRGCNEVAHRMAKWAVTAYSDEVWLGEGPNWISDV